MTTGRWVTGRSAESVRLEFGVSAETARRWAANASRIVRASIDGDMEEIRARMLATLDTVIERALSTRKSDLRAVVSAVGEQAKLLGLQTQHVHHHGSVAGLTRAQHQAELEKLQGEIAEEMKRLSEEAPP